MEPDSDERAIKPSRWVIGTILGVSASFGAGLALSLIAGDRFPAGAWQTNIGSVVIVLVGALVTGQVAGAQTSREWVRAVILTVIGLLAFGVVVFVYVAATERR